MSLLKQQEPAEADNFRRTVALATEAAAVARRGKPNPAVAEMSRKITVALDAALTGYRLRIDGAYLARLASRGQHLVISKGDHLVGNRRWQWLPQAADFLYQHLSHD